MHDETQPSAAQSTPAKSSGPAPDSVGLASRTAALSLLKAALERRGGFDEALSEPPFASLPVRERAFARALAATALRRLGAVDRILDTKFERSPPTGVRNLLRLGAVQLLFMDTSPHAAVSITVDQAETRPDTKRFKGLVNAVLRKIAKEGAGEIVAESYAPAWLFARWTAAYGGAAAEAIAARIPEEPLTDLSVRDPADLEAIATAVEADILPGGTLRTTRRGDLQDWPDYESGKWWVQDASAALPARLLNIKPGETALDMCSAPGGKTLQMAAMGATVTALDRSAGRLKRLNENLVRTGLTAEVVVTDAAIWDDERQFDAVLLDAPCSSTGAFRRHPDVLWASKPSDIAKLAELQTRLLDSAAERVAPGGRLIYCTCSLEPEEGEAQAAAFLTRHPDYQAAPMTPGEGGAAEAALTEAGTLRVHPGLVEPRGGSDGFFIARFVRTS
ncbi:MAG: RsmB/NOP family class I SAM-dependent RNA methyltransferase [Caulobacteraceae bacterium]